MKTIQNVHDTYNLLFKSGFLSIAPGEHITVTDVDFNSGIFEQAIANGHLRVYDSPDQVQAFTPTAAKIETAVVQVQQGMDAAELKKFLDSKKPTSDIKTEVEGITVTALGQPKPEPETPTEDVEVTTDGQVVETPAKASRKAKG